MSRARVALGELGENLACDELRRRGCAILARRYRRQGGEIDIIACDAGTVVFVEVKARVSTAFGTGAEAVNAIKRRRLQLVAADFLARQGLAGAPCRFDVIAVAFGAEGPLLEVYRNAFDAAPGG